MTSKALISKLCFFTILKLYNFQKLSYKRWKWNKYYKKLNLNTFFWSDLTINNKQVVLILNMVPTICYGDRSKVISIIILKIRKIKAELGGWKQIKIMMVTKDLSTMRQLRIVFQNKFAKIIRIYFEKEEKNTVQKWTPKVHY